MVVTKTSLVLSTLLLASIGIEPQPLFWAMVGATIGLSTAPTTGRMRAIIVFSAVALLSALGGTFLASVGFNIAAPFIPIARNAFSAVIAVVFHPLLTALVNAMPLLVRWAISRLPGGKP